MWLFLLIVTLGDSINKVQKGKEQQVLSFCGSCINILTLEILYSLQFLNSYVEYNISLVALTFNITLLKTLTGPLVKRYEDTKC